MVENFHVVVEIFHKNRRMAAISSIKELKDVAKTTSAPLESFGKVFENVCYC